MTDDNLQWYLEAIVHEIQPLKDNHFSGNIEFKINFIKGQIGNMNCILAKSIKRIERPQ